MLSLPRTLGFAGYSGSGKTTLIEKLIPLLVDRGLRVSVIKQSHHDIELDKPGKDSWRHRQAGATEALVTSGHRWALIHELRGESEPALEEHLARLSPCDLVLVEGFRHGRLPKIEVHRPATGQPLLHPADPLIIAIATDGPVDTALTQLNINRPDEIAAFILCHTGLQ